eukprot:134147-Hanusia_phi.AAC.2
MRLIGKQGETACSVPLNCVLRLMRLPVPSGTQKLKTTICAAALSEAVSVGKSSIKFIALQSKETDRATAELVSPLPLLPEAFSASEQQDLPCLLVLRFLETLCNLSVEQHDPNLFSSVANDAAVKCNIKSIHDGFLFPLRAGFFFAQRFQWVAKNEILSAEFDCITNRTVNLVLKLKNGDKCEFSMISKDEQPKLQQYIKAVKFGTREQATRCTSQDDEVSSIPHKQAAAQVSARADAADVDDDDDDDDEDEDESFECNESSDEESDGYEAGNVLMQTYLRLTGDHQ